VSTVFFTDRDLGASIFPTRNTLARVEAVLASEPRPFIAKVYRPSPKSRIAEGRSGSVEVKLSAADRRP